MKLLRRSPRQNRVQALNPLKPKNHDFKHAVFDIESNRRRADAEINTKFAMAGVYDGRSYTQFNSLKSLVKELCKKHWRGYSIYAHNGGKFDFLFIVRELIRQNKTFKMVVQGARIVEIKIKSGSSDQIRLRDSFSLLPMRLSALGEAFAVDDRKLTGSIDFASGEIVDRNNPLHQRYLEVDCRCLWQVLHKFSKMPYVELTGPKLTRASTALAAWRTTLKRPILITPPHVQKFVREAYAGGRTEIFRTEIRDAIDVDVNSLYPTMMLKPLPLEFVRETSDYGSFGFHEVTVKVPDCYIPILWKKTPKLFFPTGTFRGVYFSEELNFALKHGAKILKYHRGMEFTKSDDLFKDFVHDCYTLRKQNPNNAINIVAKDLMNHCYGKTGEKELKRSFDRVDPENPADWPKTFEPWRDPNTFKKWGFITVEKQKRQAHMLAHIAAAVTAWGRIHMAENIYLPYQDTIAYTDTDSGHLKGEIPDSKELGGLKREYGIKYGFYLLPKVYFIETDTGKIIKKIKGFPRKVIENIDLDNYKNKNLNFKHSPLLSLREGLIRKNEFLAHGEKIKTIQAVYDKRCTLPDGNTRPWIINLKGEIK